MKNLTTETVYNLEETIKINNVKYTTTLEIETSFKTKEDEYEAWMERFGN